MIHSKQPIPLVHICADRPDVDKDLDLQSESEAAELSNTEEDSGEDDSGSKRKGSEERGAP